MKLKTILIFAAATAALNFSTITTTHAFPSNNCAELVEDLDAATRAWFNALISGDFVRAAELSIKIDSLKTTHSQVCKGT